MVIVHPLRWEPGYVNGENPVSIFGEIHPVRATIERIESFSAHGDYHEMKEYISCQDKSLVKQVFLVHGEYEAQQFYQRTLEEAGFRNISIPEAGTEVQLSAMKLDSHPPHYERGNRGMNASTPTALALPGAITPEKVIRHYRKAQGRFGGTGTVPSVNWCFTIC